MGADVKMFLSAYFDQAKTQQDINNEDVSRVLKLAVTALEFPSARGIPVDHIDTHSLRSGGAYVLYLAGFLDTQIQKMGRWRGATF